MRAGKYNFTIEQGAKFERTLTWKDSVGAVRDLTGWTARMMIRRDSYKGAVLVSLTTTPNAQGDQLQLGGAQGTVRMYVSSTTTASLDFTRGVYDLELIPPASVDPRQDPIRLLEGAVSFDREVTRD